MRGYVGERERGQWEGGEGEETKGRRREEDGEEESEGRRSMGWREEREGGRREGETKTGRKIVRRIGRVGERKIERVRKGK